MALAAHAIHLTGQLRAVDTGSITIRRGHKIATIQFRGRSKLRGAKPGDQVRVTAKPNKKGYWSVSKLRILVRAAAPKVRLTSGPTGLVHTGAARFGFTYSGAVIWVACSLDGSAWFGCASPAAMPTLGPGDHVFGVLVMNGRHSTVLVHDWTIASDVPKVVTPTTPPKNTGLPTISGTAKSKQTLSATAGTWSGSPTGYTYQWKRCTSASDASTCSSIGGATGSKYTAQTADVNDYLRVYVTAVNVIGSTTVASAATAKTAPSV
jgi:hypothetical protein